MIVPVLGMHRSGTSLVAKVLNEMGVCMGERFPSANTWNPQGFYEDLDFMELDIEILSAAGGHWFDPPSLDRILAAGQWFTYDLRSLVEWKSQKENWGWKDPRTCLTIPLWQPHLHDDTRYIYVMRDQDAVIGSLLKREAEAAIKFADAEEEFLDHWTAADWEELIDTYTSRAWDFLASRENVLMLQFEDLIKRETARSELLRLARFLELPDTAIEQGLNVIEFR